MASIRQLCLYLEETYKAMEDASPIYLIFLISKQKHTRGEKGYAFLKYVLIM